MPRFVQRESTHGGATVRLVVDRPKGNLLTLDVVRELRAAVRGPFDPRVKLLTVEGAGSDFGFGADIAEHTADMIGRVLPDTHALLKEWLAAPVLTAAVVRGRCLGGSFELALACDFVFASSDARFGLPEIALGVFPPAAAALLPPRVGAARAAVAIVSGTAESAESWRDAGLITHVAPADALDCEVGRWVDTHLAGRSGAALAHAARAARLWLRAQAEPVLDRAERLYLDELMLTKDAAEGVNAFLEKRQPRWENR